MVNKNCLLVCCVFALMHSLVSAGEGPKDQTITVSGSSTIRLSPDEIILNIRFGGYWIDGKEARKVGISEVEKPLLEALKKAGVKSENITHSAVSLTREYDRNRKRYHKQTLEKSLSICVYNASDIAGLLAALEPTGLLERGVSAFGISELRHTKKEEYEQKAKVAAIKDAKAKGELIVGALDKTLGDIVMIEESGTGNRSDRSESFYATANNDGGGNQSGVSPIAISYTLKAVFEIK